MPESFFWILKAEIIIKYLEQGKVGSCYMGIQHSGCGREINFASPLAVLDT